MSIKESVCHHEMTIFSLLVVRMERKQKPPYTQSACSGSCFYMPFILYADDFAVLACRHSMLFLKQPFECIQAAKSRFKSYRRKVKHTLPKQHLRPLQPDLVQILTGGNAQLFTEQPDKMILA